MRRTVTILIAVMLSALLTFGAVADNTVTETTDENGNPITIITDENGNQTTIQQVEPGDDDITFEDDELDFEELEGSQVVDEASTQDTDGTKSTSQSVVKWILPIAIAGAAVALGLFLRFRKKE